jgi:hypothetical protein
MTVGHRAGVLSMKLVFSWLDVAGTPVPICVTPNGEQPPLACLLMDDGGLSIQTCVAWIDKGLGRIDAVMNGTSVEGVWDREDWGASFNRESTRVYSLHVDDFFEIVTTSSFRNSLAAWSHFFQSRPETGKSVEIHV